MREAAQFVPLLAGAIALLTAGSVSPAFAKGGHKAAGPIMDTHIHLWQVTRQGGVPWPPPANKILYRDVTPADYKAVAKKNGIVGTGIMEASNIHADSINIAEIAKKDKFFKFVVAEVEIGSADFIKNLDELSKYPQFVGIRGFLWSPKLTLDEKQLAHLKELAKRGLTLDIISRGDLNPKAKIVELATKVPDLRIIIDHLGGAKGETPNPAWLEDIKKLGAQKNIYMKFSSFFDMFNPAASEDNPWKSPTELSAYKPHFDAIFSAFGEDRIIFASNWPVVEMGGGLEAELKLAEEYLKPLGKKVRNKVMFQNAQKFYKRVPVKS